MLIGHLMDQVFMVYISALYICICLCVFSRSYHLSSSLYCLWHVAVIFSWWYFKMLENRSWRPGPDCIYSWWLYASHGRGWPRQCWHLLLILLKQCGSLEVQLPLPSALQTGWSPGRMYPSNLHPTVPLFLSSMCSLYPRKQQCHSCCDTDRCSARKIPGQGKNKVCRLLCA